MKRLMLSLAAMVALLPAPAFAAQGEPPERRGQLFVLRIEGGTEDDVNYVAYHPIPGDRSSLVVQRSLGVLSEDARAEVSAGSCPGLRAAVESLERTPWPAIHLGPAQGQPYLEREQFTGYAFYGALGYAEATSWETKLYFLDRHGQPREPFVVWASELVRTVDTCLANRR